MNRLFILSILLLGSCEATRVSLSDKDTSDFMLTFKATIPPYTRIYGLNAQNAPLPNILKQFNSNGREMYILPSSAHNDTVRYVLESLPLKKDTLAIAYKRLLVNDENERMIVSKITDARILYALTTFAPAKISLTNTNLLLSE
jgi:hypothetical protein